MSVLLGGLKRTDKRIITALVRKNQYNIDRAVYFGAKYNNSNKATDRDRYLHYKSKLPSYENSRVKSLIFGN